LGAQYKHGGFTLNINATLVGQVAFVIALLVAAIGYYLGRRKTQHPKLMALVGFFCGFFPPFGAVFIIILALR
jgi:predicted PurR-regulated permease PerM